MPRLCYFIKSCRKRGQGLRAAERLLSWPTGLSCALRSLCASLHLPRSPGFGPSCCWVLWERPSLSPLTTSSLPFSCLVTGLPITSGLPMSHRCCSVIVSSHPPECISFRREMRHACAIWKPLKASPEKASGFSSQFYAVKELREKKRSRPRSHTCENEDAQAGFSSFKV